MAEELVAHNLNQQVCILYRNGFLLPISIEADADPRRDWKDEVTGISGLQYEDSGSKHLFFFPFLLFTSSSITRQLWKCRKRESIKAFILSRYSEYVAWCETLTLFTIHEEGKQLDITTYGPEVFLFSLQSHSMYTSTHRDKASRFTLLHTEE